ncbi:hypothetical protein TYRP_004810, partial [Tyrophagus putrescentiae]
WQGALVDGQNYYGSPAQQQQNIAIQTSLPTVTVRGFLNFRTTVDGTVIVFTPSPSASQSTALANAAPQIAPTQPPRPFPEIRPTRVAHHQHGGGPVQTYPTGLVTVLGGTVVNEGSTTVYETKVIGTYISGKYAQILSSSIKVRPDAEMQSPTIRPTHSYTQPMVQPTRMASSPRQHSSSPPPPPPPPAQPVHQPKEEEPAPNAIHKKVHPLRAKSQKLIESSKARHLNARFALNPLKSRWAKQVENREEAEDAESQENKSVVKIRKPRVGTSRRFSLPPREAPKAKFNRFKSKLPPTQAEEMQQYYSTKSKLEKEAKEREELEEAAKKQEKDAIDQETKQKILEGLTSTTAAPDVVDGNADEVNFNGGSVDEQRPPAIDPSKVVKEVQTITSEVTQHVDGNHLQVKTLTLTTTIERTLHPTESEFDTQMVKPTIDLSANDLEATSIPETPALVMTRTYSVTERTMRTTVVPVFDGTSTQSHTVTESFFIRKLITAYRTLPPGDIFIESTSTLSPSMNTELINGTEILDLSMAEQGIQPSSVEGMIQATQMPSFTGNAESETKMPAALQPLMPSIDPSLSFGMQPPMFAQNQFAQKFDLNNPLLLAAVLQNPQLAAVYFGFQQMKQQQQQAPQQYNTLTVPTQVLQTETIYNTKVVSFYDGRTTRSRTILEPSGTTERVVNTFTTQLVPIMNGNSNSNNQQQQQLAAMQQAQLQNALMGTQMGMPMGAMQMPQFQMTPTIQSSTMLKTVTTVTEATMTKSKVYTLVYNALSTRYRTITSTSVTPTTITTVLTETVQVPVAPVSTLPNLNFFG